MYYEEPIKTNIKKPAVRQLPQLPQILQDYSNLTEEQIDAFEERAAIIEICGGKSRELAEYLAIRRLKIYRLNGWVLPRGIPHAGNSHRMSRTQ